MGRPGHVETGTICASECKTQATAHAVQGLSDFGRHRMPRRSIESLIQEIIGPNECQCIASYAQKLVTA